MGELSTLYWVGKGGETHFEKGNTAVSNSFFKNTDN